MLCKKIAINVVELSHSALQVNVQYTVFSVVSCEEQSPARPVHTQEVAYVISKDRAGAIDLIVGNGSAAAPTICAARKTSLGLKLCLHDWLKEQRQTAGLYITASGDVLLQGITMQAAELLQLELVTQGNIQCSNCFLAGKIYLQAKNCMIKRKVTIDAAEFNLANLTIQVNAMLRICTHLSGRTTELNNFAEIDFGANASANFRAEALHNYGRMLGRLPANSTKQIRLIVDSFVNKNEILINYLQLQLGVQGRAKLGKLEFNNHGMLAGEHALTIEVNGEPMAVINHHTIWSTGALTMHCGVQLDNCGLLGSNTQVVCSGTFYNYAVVLGKNIVLQQHSGFGVAVSQLINNGLVISRGKLELDGADNFINRTGGICLVKDIMSGQLAGKFVNQALLWAGAFDVTCDHFFHKSRDVQVVVNTAIAVTPKISGSLAENIADKLGHLIDRLPTRQFTPQEKNKAKSITSAARAGVAKNFVQLGVAGKLIIRHIMAIRQGIAQQDLTIPTSTEFNLPMDFNSAIMLIKTKAKIRYKLGFYDSNRSYLQVAGKCSIKQIGDSLAAQFMLQGRIVADLIKITAGCGKVCIAVSALVYSAKEIRLAARQLIIQGTLLTHKGVAFALQQIATSVHSHSLEPEQALEKLAQIISKVADCSQWPASTMQELAEIMQAPHTTCAEKVNLVVARLACDLTVGGSVEAGKIIISANEGLNEGLLLTTGVIKLYANSNGAHALDLAARPAWLDGNALTIANIIEYEHGHNKFCQSTASLLLALTNVKISAWVISQAGNIVALRHCHLLAAEALDQTGSISTHECNIEVNRKFIQTASGRIQAAAMLTIHSKEFYQHGLVLTQGAVRQLIQHLQAVMARQSIDANRVLYLLQTSLNKICAASTAESAILLYPTNNLQLQAIYRQHDLTALARVDQLLVKLIELLPEQERYSGTIELNVGLFECMGLMVLSNSCSMQSVTITDPASINTESGVTINGVLFAPKISAVTGAVNVTAAGYLGCVKATCTVDTAMLYGEIVCEQSLQLNMRQGLECFANSMISSPQLSLQSNDVITIAGCINSVNIDCTSHIINLAATSTVTGDCVQISAHNGGNYGRLTAARQLNMNFIAALLNAGHIAAANVLINVTAGAYTATVTSAIQTAEALTILAAYLILQRELRSEGDLTIAIVCANTNQEFTLTEPLTAARNLKLTAPVLKINANLIANALIHLHATAEQVATALIIAADLTAVTGNVVLVGQTLAHVSGEIAAGIDVVYQIEQAELAANCKAGNAIKLPPITAAIRFNYALLQANNLLYVQFADPQLLHWPTNKIPGSLTIEVLGNAAAVITAKQNIEVNNDFIFKAEQHQFALGVAGEAIVTWHAGGSLQLLAQRVDVPCARFTGNKLAEIRSHSTITLGGMANQLATGIASCNLVNLFAPQTITSWQAHIVAANNVAPGTAVLHVCSAEFDNISGQIWVSGTARMETKATHRLLYEEWDGAPTIVANIICSGGGLFRRAHWRQELVTYRNAIAAGACKHLGGDGYWHDKYHVRLAGAKVSSQPAAMHVLGTLESSQPFSVIGSKVFFTTQQGCGADIIKAITTGDNWQIYAKGGHKKSRKAWWMSAGQIHHNVQSYQAVCQAATQIACYDGDLHCSGSLVAPTVILRNMGTVTVGGTRNQYLPLVAALPNTVNLSQYLPASSVISCAPGMPQSRGLCTEASQSSAVANLVSVSERGVRIGNIDGLPLYLSPLLQQFALRMAQLDLHVVNLTANSVVPDHSLAKQQQILQQNAVALARKGRPILRAVALEEEKAKLFAAIEQGSLQEIADILVQDNNINSCRSADLTKWSPLHQAARRNQAQVARLLLQHGACIDAVDCLGCTPLHYAALNGNVAMLELLITAGANVNAKTQVWLRGDNDSPIAEDFTVLHLAVIHQQDAVVNELLAYQELAVNATESINNATALHLACFVGASNIVALLLARGADHTLCDKHNKLPSDYAELALTGNYICQHLASILTGFRQLFSYQLAASSQEPAQVAGSLQLLPVPGDPVANAVAIEPTNLTSPHMIAALPPTLPDPTAVGQALSMLQLPIAPRPASKSQDLARAAGLQVAGNVQGCTSPADLAEHATAPMLVCQQQTIQIQDGGQVQSLVHHLIYPAQFINQNIRREAGSIQADFLYLAANKLYCAGTIWADQLLYGNVRHSVVEQMVYRYQQLLVDSYTSGNWFSSKTERVAHMEEVIMAQPGTGVVHAGSAFWQGESWQQTGGVESAGAGGITASFTAAITTAPIVERHIEQYSSSARSKYGLHKAGVSGAIAVPSIHPPALCAEGKVYKYCAGSITNTSLQAACNDTVTFVATGPVTFKAHVELVQLPPTLSREKGKLVVSTGSGQIALPTFIATGQDIHAISRQAIVGNAPQFLAQAGSFIASSVEFDVQKTTESHAQYSKGLDGAAIVSQRSELHGEALIQPTFRVNNLVVHATEGDVVMISPIILADPIEGAVRLTANQGNVRIEAATLQHEQHTTLASVGLTMTGLAAIRSASCGDFAGAAGSIARDLPLLSALTKLAKVDNVLAAVNAGFNLANCGIDFYHAQQSGQLNVGAAFKKHLLKHLGFDSAGQWGIKNLGWQIKFGKETSSTKWIEVVVGSISAANILLTSAKEINIFSQQLDCNVFVATGKSIELAATAEKQSSKYCSGQLYAGLDFANPKIGTHVATQRLETTRHIATELRAATSATLIAEDDVKLRGAYLETMIAFIETTSLVLTSLQHSTQVASRNVGASVSSAGGADIAGNANAGFNQRAQTTGVLQAGIVAHDTLYIKADQQVVNTGGVLQCRSNAVALVALHEQQTQMLYQYHMPADNDCAFHALGVARSTAAAQLLAARGNPAVRALVAPEIIAELIIGATDPANDKLPRSLQPEQVTSLRTELLRSDAQLEQVAAHIRMVHAISGGTPDQLLNNRHLTLQERDSLQSALAACNNNKMQINEFAAREQTFAEYIAYYVAAPGSWLSFSPDLPDTPTQTGVIDAIAQLNNANVRIWQLLPRPQTVAQLIVAAAAGEEPAKVLQVVHQFYCNAVRTIDLYFTNCPGATTLNHFDLLHPNPELIITAQLSYKSIAISDNGYSLNVSSDDVLQAVDLVKSCLPKADDAGQILHADPILARDYRRCLLARNQASGLREVGGWRPHAAGGIQGQALAASAPTAGRIGVAAVAGGSSVRAGFA